MTSVISAMLVNDCSIRVSFVSRELLKSYKVFAGNTKELKVSFCTIVPFD